MRDFELDQRAWDDAVNAAAASKHAVGDQAHQPEPAAAIDEVDAAPDHRRGRRAGRVGEHGARTRRGAAIDREAPDVVHSPRELPQVSLRAARRNARSPRRRRSLRFRGRRLSRGPGSEPARNPAANRSPAPVVSTTSLNRRGRESRPGCRSATPSAPSRAARDHQRAHDLRREQSMHSPSSRTPVRCRTSCSLRNKRSTAAAPIISRTPRGGRRGRGSRTG